MIKKLALLGVCLAVVIAARGYAANNEKPGAMVPSSEMVWKEIAPGSPVTVTVLWGDRAAGEYGALIKLPAGYTAPIHAHTGDYYAVNLTGTWRHSFDGGSQKDLPPGSYVFQPGMGWHGDACIGTQDCTLLIFQHVKGDFIPKP